MSEKALDLSLHRKVYRSRKAEDGIRANYAGDDSRANAAALPAFLSSDETTNGDA
jgi:hypothetical protein